MVIEICRENPGKTDGQSAGKRRAVHRGPGSESAPRKTVSPEDGPMTGGLESRHAHKEGLEAFEVVGL